ncbi:unnamed protein product [Soboliphyme baturini]|uniref:Fibronectin type-III domain-containing protein n=1 Tax=Soboliphyme baturini TaxID=241478 RepID=A0A183J6T0_9BILA|nr:unnamed protein product [Soboliphyme baturini]
MERSLIKGSLSPKTEQEFPNAVSLSFLQPHPPHGKLDDYRIRHTPIDRISWYEVRKPAIDLTCVEEKSNDGRLCYRLADLEPDRQYVVQVSAHTEGGGWSDWSKSWYVKTRQAEIPVMESPIKISLVGSNSITLIWDGINTKEHRNLKGYILEYNVGGDSQWVQHGDMIPVAKDSESGQLVSSTVSNLQPNKVYYFRVKLVDANDRQGLPGPQLRALTPCGKPSQPPRNVRIDSENYKALRVRWESVPKHQWNCDNVTYVIKFHNSTHSGYVDVSPSLQVNEYWFETAAGVRWAIQMRTQSVGADNVRHEASEWSPEKVFVVPGVPELVFMDLKKRGSDAVQVSWDVSTADKDWPYGVDITYVLKQKGDCAPKQELPVTEYNVHDRSFLIEV